MNIVANFEVRMVESPEFQARLARLLAGIQARYAAEMATAGWWVRLCLRWRIDREYRRERKQLMPSATAL